MDYVIYGAALLLLVNILTFSVFAHDKKQARLGEWRVPEKTLLSLAFFGGWFGAKLAQRKFRHKTRKQPFRGLLNVIPMVWALIGAVVLVAPW